MTLVRLNRRTGPDRNTRCCHSEEEAADQSTDSVRRGVGFSAWRNIIHRVTGRAAPCASRISGVDADGLSVTRFLCFGRQELHVGPPVTTFETKTTNAKQRVAREP